MDKRLWSVVRTLACLAICLMITYFCMLLSSLGEYWLIGGTMVLMILIVVFSNFIFDDWIALETLSEHAEEGE